LALKVSKRGLDEWHELPQGIDVLLAVPTEIMEEVSSEARFVLSEFIDLMNKKQFMPSRIVLLLQDLMSDANEKIKTLKMILERDFLDGKSTYQEKERI